MKSLQQLLRISTRKASHGQRPISTSTTLRRPANSVVSLENKINLYEIRWSDNHISKFHHVWLRDHCRCPKCVEPSSGQKLRTRSDMPKDMKPISFQMLVQLTLQEFSFRMDDSLVISWSDQHETKLPLSWLRENCYSRANLEARRNRQQPYLWDVPAIEKRGGFPQFEYSRVMNDDKAVWEWVKALNKYGCALVVNGPTTEGSIAALTERIAYIRKTMYGVIFDVISVPNPINVAYTSVELPPHMDLCYYESPPGLQLLYCLRFDQKTGGESSFIDGFKICEELKRRHPESFKTLSTIHTEYFKFDKINMMRYSRPIIMVDEFDDVIGINWSPNFEAPLRVPEEHVEKFYKAYSDWVSIMRDPSLELSFRLQPGTCVAFNNRRVLHARKSFDENAGTRHLQGTYIDLDEFSNRFRTLQRRFGAEDEQPTELSRIGNYSH